MSKKQKAPAFQFYAADFLIGVMTLSDEETGVYMKMLCTQWIHGFLPNDQKLIKKMVNLDKKPSQKVLEKFKICEDNLLRNERLESVRKDRETFIESRVKNANSRWNKPEDGMHVHDSSMCYEDALQSSVFSLQSSSVLKDGQSTEKKVHTKNKTTCPISSDVSEILKFIWENCPAKSRERSSKKELLAEWNKMKAVERPTIQTIKVALDAWNASAKWLDGYSEGIDLWVKKAQWENLPLPANSKSQPPPKKIDPYAPKPRNDEY
jgi:uncharacterized protein YdaU (DUF1376 family)